jgi:hypothetical protein
MHMDCSTSYGHRSSLVFLAHRHQRHEVVRHACFQRKGMLGGVLPVSKPAGQGGRNGLSLQANYRRGGRPNSSGGSQDRRKRSPRADDEEFQKLVLEDISINNLIVPGLVLMGLGIVAGEPSLFSWGGWSRGRFVD